MRGGRWGTGARFRARLSVGQSGVPVETPVAVNNPRRAALCAQHRAWGTDLDVDCLLGLLGQSEELLRLAEQIIAESFGNAVSDGDECSPRATGQPDLPCSVFPGEVDDGENEPRLLLCGGAGRTGHLLLRCEGGEALPRSDSPVLFTARASDPLGLCGLVCRFLLCSTPRGVATDKNTTLSRMTAQRITHSGIAHTSHRKKKRLDSATPAQGTNERSRTNFRQSLIY